MSKLISGKEALIALANGVKPSEIEGMFAAGLGDILYLSIDGKVDLCVKHLTEKLFRLKPRTITINGVELNQCYSVAIDFTKNEVKVEFKNRNDAEALHDVISKLYGFK